MPTFYWVGKGCPKDGTATNSHLWGLSDFDWNNPSNWVVAHSLHAHKLLRLGQYGYESESVPTILVLTEVYGIPNRCPGPGDEVFVGHFPWLRHQPQAEENTTPYYSEAFPDIITQSTKTIIGVNDLFWNASAWSAHRDTNGYRSAPAFSRNMIPGYATVQQVLYAPVDTLTGKVTTVSVPKALEGTSSIPLYKRFYATNTKSLSPSGIASSPSAFSVWWDGSSTWLNGVQPAIQVTEIDKIYSLLGSDMNQKNLYRNSQKMRFYPSYAYFRMLPKMAETPLLWGGCVAGTTGTTAASGISGGSGYTYWQNANTISANPNLLAATSQALDTLNIVMYSDNLVDGVSGSNITFYDPYPFKSVGDGLYGEEYETVVKNLRNPYCGSWTGGSATSIPSSGVGDCYNCYGAGATGASSQRLLTLDRILSNSLTAEGQRITGLFVKANHVNVRTPFEWNKYAGNNPAGFQHFREDRYAISRANCDDGYNSGYSWIDRQLGDSCVNSSGEYDGDCATRFGPYGPAGRNNNSKFVEIRLAEFFNGGQTGADPENLKTILHADMRFGQFNLAYGRVQEANLGVPHASYGNEYGEGNKSIDSLTNYNDSFAPALVSWSYPEILQSLNSYTMNTQAQISSHRCGIESTFNRALLNPDGFGKANPFWPSSGVYFLGGISGANESRVNQLNLFSVSATINPMTKVGVSRIFLGYGDNVEFGGQCLTANTTSPFNYTKYMGNIYVSHGYPVVSENNRTSDRRISMGSFLHGSTVTGDSFYAPYITIAPTGLIVDLNGGTGSIGQPGGSGFSNITVVKTAYTSPIFNSQIGDMVISDTDFVFLSPDDIQTNDRQKYGNKVIDRLIVKNSCVVDHSKDDGAYLHFGRILSSGSTGGTGSVYGGIMFQGEVNQFVVPPAGARYWVSRIDGNTIDSRQKTMSVGFVASNFPEGKLDALGNFPSILDGNGTVTTTGKNPNAYSKNEIVTIKKDTIMPPLDDEGDIEVQA